MQGMVVVPIFAGYDQRRGRPVVQLRRHRRPLRGERVRRHRLRQPARRHGRQGGLPLGDDAGRRDRAGPAGAVGGGRRRLGDGRSRRAAGHLPRGATITAEGYVRVADDELRPRYEAIAAEVAHMSMSFYVAPEQMMKDRADYARKGIARGRALVAVAYDDGVASSPRTRPTTSARSARSTTASPSPVSAATTSSTSSAWTACGPPTSRATSSAGTTSTPAAWPTATPSSWARSSPTR